MAGVTHPNVVQLRGFSLNPFFLVLEWVANGDLYQWLHKPEQAAKLTNPMRIRMALDIAQGMAFLHSRSPPILHRDLKTPNVFVASIEPGAPVMAKVADFGLASRLFISELKERTKNRAVETPTWLAPEVLLEQPYTEKSDVYVCHFDVSRPPPHSRTPAMRLASSCGSCTRAHTRSVSSSSSSATSWRTPSRTAFGRSFPRQRRPPCATSSPHAGTRCLPSGHSFRKSSLRSPTTALRSHARRPTPLPLCPRL